MKGVSPALATELGKETTTLCRLWRITPVERETLYYTDHDQDLVIGGHTYIATTSFEASAVQTAINAAASNLEVTVLLEDGKISFLELQRGIFDNAVCELELVSYTNLAATPLRLYGGLLKQISEPTKSGAILSLGGNIGRMAKSIGEIYTPFCRADFGDSRCGFDIETVAADFIVSSAVGGHTFTAPELSGMAENRWQLGVVKWSVGANAGTAQEVAISLATGQIKLAFRSPLPIQEDDEGRIYQGCPKTVAACVAYDNKPNYRGEPEVPGDSYLGG